MATPKAAAPAKRSHTKKAAPAASNTKGAAKAPVTKKPAAAITRGNATKTGGDGADTPKAKGSGTATGAKAKTTRAR